MSTERTGGLPPMDHGKAASETKAAREEKQKVEKVREIDADEETQRRRKKFQMMMGDEDLPVDLEPRVPSPFETQFYATEVPAVEPGVSPAAGGLFGGGAPDLGDVEDSMVPSPSYSPPPDVTSIPQASSEEDDDLPQSSDFWDDIDLPPDQPPQPVQMQETPQSQARSQPASQQAAQTGKPGQKQKKGTVPQGPTAPSLLGPPGKPTSKAPAAAFAKSPPEKPPFFTEKPGKKGAPLKKEQTPEEKQGEMPTSSFAGTSESPQQIPTLPPGRRKEEKPQPGVPSPIAKEEMAIPFEAEKGGEGGRREKGEKGHEMEIVSPSLPSLPPDIQPAAQYATEQATPYLRPETMSLFYQMVGTIYVMAATPSGVARTEILLNNPAFADSKFFGSTITIEKYATAPDSFNIRLTGNDAAVTAFKDNIPSLVAAFQNGKYNFRINRVEAEYSTIKPVFRRKEKGEEGGFGGDLRDRRK